MANIVVVEDDEDISWTLSELLALQGHSVRTARNGQEGLVLIRKSRPDLIVADIEMPILSGPGMANRLLVEDSGLEEIPILLISGFSDLRKIAKEIGTSYFVAKPFNVSEVLALIEKALLERRAPAPQAR